MRRAARIDTVQPLIVETLRKAGATVQHLHMVGHGCPDLGVGYQGKSYFLEVKAPGGKLTKDERAWHEAWQGQVAIVHTPEEALEAIGAAVYVT